MNEPTTPVRRSATRQRMSMMLADLVGSPTPTRLSAGPPPSPDAVLDRSLEFADVSATGTKNSNNNSHHVGMSSPSSAGASTEWLRSVHAAHERALLKESTRSGVAAAVPMSVKIASPVLAPSSPASGGPAMAGMEPLEGFSLDGSGALSTPQRTMSRTGSKRWQAGYEDKVTKHTTPRMEWVGFSLEF
eukprot:PhM_4_TR4054/c0_g3_i1/m.99487